MEIKVFGPGCVRCQTVEQRTFNVLASLDIEANVEKVTDLAEMARAGVMGTPALSINGYLKCSGRVPSEAEIAAWIKEAAR